jgi:hypothetical protein
MKRLLGGVFLLLVCSQAFSQKMYELSHEVLVPAGNIVTLEGLTYQQTIGEIAVEVSLPSFYNLSQGYQQPRFIPKPDLSPREGNDVEFYPNPLTESNNWIFHIRIYGALGRHYKVYICSLPGSVIYTNEYEFPTKHDDILEVDMAKYSRGIYVANVRSTDGLIDKSFKIDKL